ncbi:MAG: hypothetical protein FVQ81_07995 [Candidatus Glassbacteria bacterium]|nr:hypothetical protein [Candidatus Glassbacteria bacterium]
MTAVAIAAAVLPRLGLGWGMDSDAWRVAQTSARLWHGSGYQPSRLPGNPAFELMTAPAAGLACPLAANMLVFAFFLAAVWVFHRIAGPTRAGARWSTLFALTPALLLNAATTMDYIPALACLLLACLLAYSGRAVAAGFVLGIAGGFRISHLLFSLPLLYYNHGRGISPWRNLAAFAAASFTGLLFYLPVFSSRGMDALLIGSKFLSGREYLLITGYNALALLGPLSAVTIIVIAALGLRNFGMLMRSTGRESGLRARLELASVCLFTGLFVLHPDESAYLLPVVPFLYLLLARFIGTRALTVLALLIVSHGVITLELKGGTSGRRTLAPHLTYGVLADDWRQRVELNRLRDSLPSLPVTEPALVLTGMGPQLSFGNPHLAHAGKTAMFPLSDESVPRFFRLPDREVYVAGHLAPGEAEILRHDGFSLYYFSTRAPSAAMRLHGYHPAELGMARIATDRDHAFWK